MCQLKYILWLKKIRHKYVVICFRWSRLRTWRKSGRAPWGITCPSMSAINLVSELVDQPSNIYMTFFLAFKILTGMLYNYCLFSVHVYRTCSLCTAQWPRKTSITLQHWRCLEMHDGSLLSPEEKYMYYMSRSMTKLNCTPSKDSDHAAILI